MAQMKKLVMKVDLHDNDDKRKALKIVSALPGVDSISMEMKDMKLTVIGTVDAVKVASKLRKFWKADIILLGPAKEPEKKEEPKKEEPKKDEAAKKEEPNKKEEPKKEEPKKEAEEPKKEEPKKKEPEVALGIMPYRQYYPPMNRPYYPPPNTYYYYPHQSVEENPNGCVIL